MRSRRCGASMQHAPSTSQAAWYRRRARSPRTPASPRAARLRVFSTKTIRGRTKRMMRENSNQRPDRDPSSPFPLVLQTAMSVQGNPPIRRSTGGGSRPITLSKHGTPGQCLASTRRQNGSDSQCHATRAPVALSTPRSRPPTPLKSEPICSATKDAPPGIRPCGEPCAAGHRSPTDPPSPPANGSAMGAPRAR